MHIDLTMKKLFIGDCISVTADIKHHVAQLSAVIVPSRMSADAIVVYDIAKPGTRNHWVAVLLGLPIVGSRCLTGASGPAIEYAASVTRRLTVCITPEFHRAFPVLSAIITLASAKPQARWRLVPAVPARAGATWLVFATPAETASGRVPRACSPSIFMRRFGKPIGMTMGVCGL